MIPLQEKPARVDIDPDDLKRIVALAHSATLVDMFGGEVDAISGNSINVSIDNRRLDMSAWHIIITYDFVSFVVLIHSDEEEGEAVVVDVDTDGWRPRQRSYHFTGSTMPKLKQFL